MGPVRSCRLDGPADGLRAGAAGRGGEGRAGTCARLLQQAANSAPPRAAYKAPRSRRTPPPPPPPRDAEHLCPDPPPRPLRGPPPTGSAPSGAATATRTHATPPRRPKAQPCGRRSPSDPGPVAPLSGPVDPPKRGARDPPRDAAAARLPGRKAWDSRGPRRAPSRTPGGRGHPGASPPEPAPRFPRARPARSAGGSARRPGIPETSKDSGDRAARGGTHSDPRPDCGPEGHGGVIQVKRQAQHVQGPHAAHWLPTCDPFHPFLLPDPELKIRICNLEQCPREQQADLKEERLLGEIIFLVEKDQKRGIHFGTQDHKALFAGLLLTLEDKLTRLCHHNPQHRSADSEREGQSPIQVPPTEDQFHLQGLGPPGSQRQWLQLLPSVTQPSRSRSQRQGCARHRLHTCFTFPLNTPAQVPQRQGCGQRTRDLVVEGQAEAPHPQPSLGVLLVTQSTKMSRDESIPQSRPSW